MDMLFFFYDSFFTNSASNFTLVVQSPHDIPQMLTPHQFYPLNKISPQHLISCSLDGFSFAVELSSGIFIYFSLVLNYFFQIYIIFLIFLIPYFAVHFPVASQERVLWGVNCLKLCISENAFVLLLYLIFNLAGYELLVRNHFLSFSVNVEITNAIQIFYSVLFL